MEIDVTEAGASRAELPVSEAGSVARIVAAGVAGALGGLLLGGLVYGSLVVGLFGALGGAVVGMIGALKALEPR
jgi:hypothetical protein